MSKHRELQDISGSHFSFVDVISEFDPRFLRFAQNDKSNARAPIVRRASRTFRGAELEVEGEAEPYKDAKLFPGGSREWNWRETETSHRPGIQIADVQELLEHGSKVVVLSRGMAECLHVPRETLDFLKERQIRCARIADAACCGALQQARANRGGWRLVPYDVLTRSACNSLSRARSLLCAKRLRIDRDSVTSRVRQYRPAG